MNVQNEESRSTPVEENINQVMKKFREVIVLSLVLLFLLPDMSMHYLMRRGNMKIWTTIRIIESDDPMHPLRTEMDIRIPLDGSERSISRSAGLSDYPDMCPLICDTLQLTADNLEEAFKGNNELYETTAALSIDKISVYKSPLSAPFSSSKNSVRNVVQGQYLYVDYHAYVVFNTSDGMWWALDKTAEGIFVSWGENRGAVYMVSTCFNGHLRPDPEQLLISDDSEHTVSVLVRRLKYMLKSNKYDLIENNCQHFAKEIFDKFAKVKIWELSTVSEFASPLMQLWRLLKIDGVNTAKLLYIVFVFYELYLLSGESREKESYHHLFVVYTVIIVTGIVLLIDFLWRMLPSDLLSFLLHVKPLVLLFALFVEARFYSFLGTIRKRAIEYRKKCQSATWFKKYFSLPLGYTMVYVGPVCTCMYICSKLIVLVGSANYIVYAYITSDLYPSPIEFVEYLHIKPIKYFSEISRFVPITFLYILAVIFLNWRN